MWQLCSGLILSCVLVLQANGQQRAPPGVNPGQYQQNSPPPQQGGQQQQFQGQPPPQGQQFQGQVPQQQFQQPPPQQQQFQQPPPPQQQQQPPQQQPHQHQKKLDLHKDVTKEKEHMAEHMDVPIDTSNMSEQELQFHYFKMHDADGNNKLDGCELVKSLIHWHDGDSHDGHNHEPPIFEDKILAKLIDPVLKDGDMNNDGMIDYSEFISAAIRNQKGEGPVIELSS